MKEQFVTYEIALALKKLGFDEECFGVYYDYKGDPKLCFDSLFSNKDMIIHTNEHSYYALCLAPIWQQIIDWFDNKNIIIGIDINPGTLFYRVHLYKRYYHNPGRLVIRKYFLSGEFDNFISKEEAREQAILKCIELCKNQNKNNIRNKERITL